MAKKSIPKKSLFEKAVTQFQSTYPHASVFIDGVLYAGGAAFRDSGDAIEREESYVGPVGRVNFSQDSDVGDILQFFHLSISSMDETSPPTQLGGNGKDLEEALMTEAGRLERLGELCMSRYGTMVSLVDNEWRPIPSYPDFEGVRRRGRQFIIEAKVCTKPSFRIHKDYIKHKQVKHMLARGRLGVDCYVLIHFNARLGRTFYDPPFTVAIPVKPIVCGGWEVWEQFAHCKDKNAEFPPLTREIATQIGIPVKWHIPARSTNLRPDFWSFLPTE